MTVDTSIRPHLTRLGDVQHIRLQFHTAIHGCLLQQGTLDSYAQSRPEHEYVSRAVFAFHGEMD